MRENSIDIDNSGIETDIIDLNELLLNNNLNSEEDELQKKPEKKNSSGVCKLIYHLSGPKEKLLIFLGIIGSIISAISGPIMSYTFGGAINDFSDIQDISQNAPNYKEKMDQFVLNIKDVYSRYLILGAILFCSNFLQMFSWQYSAFLQIYKLKENYFTLIMSQEQAYFDNCNSFELVTKLQTELENIELGLGEKFGFVIQKIFTVISGISISFIVNWKLSLIVLTVSPITIFFIIYFTSSLKKSAKITKDAYEQAGGIAEEILYNIQTICSFGNYNYEQYRFNSKIDVVFNCDKSKALKYGISQSLIGLSTYIAFTIAIFYGKKLMIDNAEKTSNDEIFKVGDMLTVILNTNTAVWSFTMIAPNIKIIIDSTYSANDYFDLLQRQPKIHFCLFPVKKKRNEIIGQIEFKNVSFSYNDEKNNNNNNRKVLDNFSLKVTPGQKIALVGESGCGKSTVVNLLERIYELDFYKQEEDLGNDSDNELINNNNAETNINSNESYYEDNTKSGIFLDNINIKNYDLEFYRSLIGYVQQEPVLFNKSIRDNIIFGREKQIKDLGLDTDKLIKEACELANVNGFLSKLEGKLDYKVGIKGSKLSGGQKQRIAIARAILLNPKIIILDEATSALDYKNEQEVQKALDNLKFKNITTFVISHRLCTILNSDMIYFMKEGKIVEQGTHKELFAKNGLYTKLIRNQVDENGNLKVNEETQENSFKSQLIRKRTQVIYSKKNKQNNSVKEEQLSIKALFEIVKEKKKLIFLGIITSIFLGATQTLSGYIFGFSINALSETNQESMKKDTNIWGSLYMVDAVFIAIFMYFKLYSLDVISSFLTSNLRKKIFKKYLELPMEFFDKVENSPGALLTKLSMDTVQLNSVVQMIVGDLFHSFGSLVTGITLALYYDWRLTLISFCFIPFIIGSNLLVSLTKRGGRKSYKQMNIEAGGILSESVINTKTIFSFNFQKKAVKLYMEIIESEKKNYIRDSVLFGVLTGLGIFFSFANHATLFYSSKEFFINGTLEYSNMNITIQILILMVSSISNGLRGIFDIKTAKSAFESIFSLLGVKSEIDHTPEGNINKIKPDDIKGKVEFKNVYFRYPIYLDDNNNSEKENPLLEKEKYILKNVTFTIKPGQKVALVGFSGSGKSTVIKLLERFYQPTKGSVLIDGIDIQDYDLYELRKKIGLVGQEPILFRRSVYENIEYGKLNEKRENILEAAKMASIDHLFKIKCFKNDLEDTKSMLSGGEKQRVSIARAFLKNPKILLLDEPTSALDKKNEIEISESLDKLMKGRTTFIVTHRLDTIKNADVILVFENGRLVQKGTHEQLININGQYKFLFALN
jgi:ABC-type multidrug transport system fused ATPase/permease subunit